MSTGLVQQSTSYLQCLQVRCSTQAADNTGILVYRLSTARHPGLAALEKWDTIEYAAGYRARLAAIPDSETAHHCWRCGWEDADTEALELDRHKRVLADGREDAYAETWGLLFDAGGDARANGVPFDEGRTQPWKEGWIAADINLGLAGIED
jgi:hypothetical protein